MYLDSLKGEDEDEVEIALIFDTDSLRQGDLERWSKKRAELSDARETNTIHHNNGNAVRAAYFANWIKSPKGSMEDVSNMSPHAVRELSRDVLKLYSDVTDFDPNF